MHIACRSSQPHQARPSLAKSVRHRTRRMSLSTRVLAIVTGLLAAAAIDAGVLAYNWPFTRKAIELQLRNAAQGDVSILEFRQTFFPQPGCVAVGLVIRHGPGLNVPPLITADRLDVAGDYAALVTFSKRVRDVRVEGMHIRIPPKDDGPGGDSGEKSAAGDLTIDRFIADRAVLEFLPKDPGDQPFVLNIHREFFLQPAPKRQWHSRRRCGYPSLPAK